MRLTQLQYFMAVYEHQNITKAAEKLHISQPSITIALKNWRMNIMSTCSTASIRRCF